MYRPPETDSEDEYDGFVFGDSFVKDYKSHNNFVAFNTDQDIERAIDEGDLNKLINEIDECNIDINSPLTSGSLILALACRAGHVDIVKYLLDKEANPNKQTDSVTILMDACASTEPSSKVTRIVKMLLDKGAVINVSDKYGTTPFMLACQNGHADVVRLLIKDVSFDACDNQGCTPIFYAIEHNRIDIVKLLVDAGVNATLPNKKGYTPRQVAQFHGFNDILEFLPRDKDHPYQVPTNFLSYNNICDMIPRIFLKTECPEYFQDVYLILCNIDMEIVLEYFAKAHISLSEFLTMNDARLEEIGIEYPIHRQKILNGLLNFHLNQWTKNSIARVRKGRADNFYDILILSANHLQNLVIITSTLKYVKGNLTEEHFGTISKEILQALKHNLKNYKAALKDLKETNKYLQSFTPDRPPLYIDYDEYLVEKKRSKVRKFFKYTFVIAISMVICLKVKNIF